MEAHQQFQVAACPRHCPPVASPQVAPAVPGAGRDWPDRKLWTFTTHSVRAEKWSDQENYTTDLQQSTSLLHRRIQP